MTAPSFEVAADSLALARAVAPPPDAMPALRGELTKLPDARIAPPAVLSALVGAPSATNAAGTK